MDETQTTPALVLRSRNFLPNDRRHATTQRVVLRLVVLKPNLGPCLPRTVFAPAAARAIAATTRLRDLLISFFSYEGSFDFRVRRAAALSMLRGRQPERRLAYAVAARRKNQNFTV